VAELPTTPRLTDGVVLLREFVAEDASALASIWADAAIRTRNSVREPTTDAAEQWVHKVPARNAAGRSWEWAIVDVASGALAGRRALKDICWNKRRAAAASWVAPQFRGRRLAAARPRGPCWLICAARGSASLPSAPTNAPLPTPPMRGAVRSA
jgi:RimJ/RimL family protein N-acetyltransferase